MQDPIASTPESSTAARPMYTDPAVEWSSSAAVPPPALSSGPDAASLLKALRRRWLLALVLGLLAAAGAVAAVWFFLPAQHTVFSQLHVSSTNPGLMGDKNEGRGEFSTYMKTQMGRIRSRYVLTAALRRDEIKRLSIIRQQADPVAWLEEELKVDSPDGSELVVLTMLGPDPGELIPLLNAIAQSYLQEVASADRKRRGDRLTELEDIYTQFNEKLRKKRDTWHSLAKQLNTTDSAALSQRQLMLMNTFAEVRRQHTQVQFDLMKLKNRHEAFRGQEKTIDQVNVPEVMLNEALDGDPVVRQLQTQIARWEEVIAHYRQNAQRPEREPGMIAALSEQQALVKRIDARKGEMRGVLIERLRQKTRADYDLALVQLQHEIAPLEKQEQGLRAEAERLATEADKFGTSTTEMEMLGADMKRDEKTAAKMGEELEELRVEVRSPPRVSLYQEAAAQRKDRKRMLMALIGAPVTALLLVCLGIAFWEFRGRRIHTTDEVMTGLGLRVVGSIPVSSGVLSAPLLQGTDEHDSDHEVLEAIDGIRTSLLRDAAVEGTRLLMVTSAVAGEGKTTLATHLAGSLARAGRRTLLIDGDLRRPSIHQLFEMPPQPGLSEVLLGEVHLAEATLSSPVNGLWVMPAGQWDREVMQTLAQDRARDLFERLRNDYDYVVIDSHPVLPVTDTLLIAQHVDAVLFALLREVSEMPRVYTACQRLTILGVRVLGAVINGAPAEAYGGSYQYSAPAETA